MPARLQLPSILGNLDLEEEREDFLTFWNGEDEPNNFGTVRYGRTAWPEYTGDRKSGVGELSQSRVYDCAEDAIRAPADDCERVSYGYGTTIQSKLCADRSGSDLRPVGPAACARRGCIECCYCRQVPVPEVHLEMRMFTFEWPNFPATADQGPGVRMVRKWLTVPQLQDKMLHTIMWLHRPKMATPVPVYLLERQSPGNADEKGE